MRKQFFLPLMTYPDQTSDMMIGNALDLARNCAASLHAAAVEIIIPPITDPWASLLIDTGKMVRDAEQASAERGGRLRNLVITRAAAADVEIQAEIVAASQPDAVDAVAGIARHHDLTLLQSAPQFEALSQAVIFGSGRPVILYPDRPCSGRIDHVVIAWDGSRAAARAVGDVMPFIGEATEVSIVYALDEKPIDEAPARRLVDSLAARGVKVDAYPIHILGQPIGDMLQSKATDLRADLLVMGGYGHSRMREFILGGATRDVLGNPQLPVLISH